MKGFKDIDKLSISECCRVLGIDKKDLPGILDNVDIYKKNEEIVARLKLLINYDNKTFRLCSTIEEYEKYLNLWQDGLHIDTAKQRIVQLKTEAEESNFYNTNKNSISGLKTYIKRYPNGKFVKDAQISLNSKRKTRKTCNIILLITACIVAIVICLLNYLPVSHLNVSDKVTFGKRGGDETITISTDANDINIDVLESSDWINVKRDGDILSIKAVPNTDDKRSAYITINAYSSFFGKQFNCITQNIKVSQSSGLPTYLETNTSEISFDKYGNCSSNYVTAKTDGFDIIVSSQDSWINFSKNIEEGEDDIVAQIEINTGINNVGEKNGEVIVKCNDFVKHIKVYQESGLATKFYAERNNLTVEEEGGSSSLKIVTDGTIWSVKSAPDWLTTSVNLKENSLDISASKNNDNIQTGTITLVSNNGHTESISITQKGNPSNFSSSVENIYFKSTGESRTIDINNNSYKDIYVNCNESWLSCSVINKNCIKLSCSDNDNSSSRSAYIDITCGSLVTEIYVSQAGDKANLKANKSFVGFETSSDYKYININNESRKVLSVREYESWLSASVINKNKIKISCNRNYDDPPRSGTVYVSCGDEQISVTVKQSGWSKCRRCGGSGELSCPKNGQMNIPYWSFLYENGIHYYVEWPMAIGMAAHMKRYERCNTCGGSGHIECPDCDGEGKSYKSY